MRDLFFFGRDSKLKLCSAIYQSKLKRKPLWFEGSLNHAAQKTCNKKYNNNNNRRIVANYLNFNWTASKRYTKNGLGKFFDFSHQSIERKINYLNKLPHRAGKYAYTVFTVSSLSQSHVLAITSKFKSYCEINICGKKKKANKQTIKDIFTLRPLFAKQGWWCDRSLIRSKEPLWEPVSRLNFSLIHSHLPGRHAKLPWKGCHATLPQKGVKLEPRKLINLIQNLMYSTNQNLNLNPWFQELSTSLEAQVEFYEWRIEFHEKKISWKPAIIPQKALNISKLDLCLNPLNFRGLRT